jgi:predicted MFS family arabinose efflux permease
MNSRLYNTDKSSQHRDYLKFLAGVSLFGFSAAIINAVFNNFLNETFSMGNMARGVLELPRELPGFLVAFVSAIFFFMSGRRLAAMAHFLACIGVYLLGHYSMTYGFMLVWLFIYSLGQHIFLPLTSSIGMEFAEKNREGKRLGQITGANNFATIAGSVLVFLGFRFLDFSFSLCFTLAAAVLLVSFFFLMSMKKDDRLKSSSKLTLRREYGLYYWLCILFGTRKQIFLTFAPWVLGTVFNRSTAVVATLLTGGGAIGIVFHPLLGRAIDRLGERFILMAEAAVLVFVCIGYGFAKMIFDGETAFHIAAACFILDQMLISVGMARATYLKKIALKPEDVSQTLTMGVTIDHVFSISIALVSGLIWNSLGYQYVFLLGALISVINLFSASRIRLKK